MWLTSPPSPERSGGVQPSDPWNSSQLEWRQGPMMTDGCDMTDGSYCNGYMMVTQASRLTPAASPHSSSKRCALATVNTWRTHGEHVVYTWMLQLINFRWGYPHALFCTSPNFRRFSDFQAATSLDATCNGTLPAESRCQTSAPWRSHLSTTFGSSALKSLRPREASEPIKKDQKKKQ